MHILVIEDDNLVLTEIAAALQNDGDDVKTAMSLREADTILTLANQKLIPAFDAVLADFWLESGDLRTSGAETYWLVRQLVGPSIPLLCASSDIPMWERLREEHEDARMYTRRKTCGPHGKSVWDIPWVRTTLAEVKDLPLLPPRPTSRPGILVAAKDASVFAETIRVLEDSGYHVTTCTTVGEATARLLPRKGAKPNLVAVISGYELATGTGRDVFILNNIAKSPPAFIASGELTQWTDMKDLATQHNLPLHVAGNEPALIMAKLAELGIQA